MSRKILLADDSVTIQKVVSITLAHEDIDLTIVDNGAEALAKAQQIRPDIILLDVVMPDRDGYQVCEEIKRSPELAHIPIILLTGTFEPFDEDKAGQVGANDYIKKPFESHALIKKIKEMSFKGGGSPRRQEQARPEAPDDSAEFIMGDETDIEFDIDTTPGMATDSSGFETPKESAPTMQPRREAPPVEKKSDDIWSVEEFEDIAGSTLEEPDLSPPKEEPDPWGDVTIATDSVPGGFDIGGPSHEPLASSQDAGEFFQTDDMTQIDSGEFELGDEISEDELSQFLDEEGLEVGLDGEIPSEMVSTPPRRERPEADASFDDIGMKEEAPSAGGDFDAMDFQEPSPKASVTREQDDVFQLGGDDMEIPLEDLEDVTLGDGMDLPTDLDDGFTLGSEIDVPDDFKDTSAEELSADDGSFSLDDVEIPPEFQDDFTLEGTGDETTGIADIKGEPGIDPAVDFDQAMEPASDSVFDMTEPVGASGDDDVFVPDESLDDTDFLWEEGSRTETDGPFVDDAGGGDSELDLSFSDRADEFENQHRFESGGVPETPIGDAKRDRADEAIEVDDRLMSRAMEEVSSRVSGGISNGFGAAEPGTEEYDRAVNEIAREVIEKVAWEVVPELAEMLIKEEIKRLKGEKG
jgi:CheY-like chemotaxis protein